MIRQLNFELRRNKKGLFYFIVVLFFSNFLMMLIDPDHEKVVISLSVINIIMPCVYICLDFFKLLGMDFVKESRYLYLASPRTKGEILGSRIITTLTYGIAYVIIVLIFKDINFLGSGAVLLSVALMLLTVIVHGFASFIYLKFLT